MNKVVKYFSEAIQPIKSRDYYADWKSAVKLIQVYHPISLQKRECRFLHGNIVQLHKQERNFRKFHKVCTLAFCEIKNIEPLTPGATQLFTSASTGAAIGTVLGGPIGLILGLAAGVAGSSGEKVKISMFDNEANCDFVVITDLDAGQRIAYFVSNKITCENIYDINNDWLDFQNRVRKFTAIVWILILVFSISITILFVVFNLLFS